MSHEGAAAEGSDSASIVELESTKRNPNNTAPVLIFFMASSVIGNSLLYLQRLPEPKRAVHTFVSVVENSIYTSLSVASHLAVDVAC